MILHLISHMEISNYRVANIPKPIPTVHIPYRNKISFSTKSGSLDLYTFTEI